MIGKAKGFSAIELLIVVAIVVILAAVAGVQYSKWIKRYNVEREMREMHTDLMNARARAVMRDRAFFVILAAGRYTIYEDTNPTPDGDGTLQTANDTVYLLKDLNSRYPIRWSDAANTQLMFNSRGLYEGATDDKTICTNAGVESDYNCIVVEPTRVGLGKLTAAGGACDTVNCIVK